VSEIRNLEELPAIAQMCTWSPLIKKSPSAMSRAFHEGKLKGSKMGRRTLLFAREDVLNWLGFQVQEEEPASLPPRRVLVAKPRHFSPGKRAR
jgi:hypothetical protein